MSVAAYGMLGLGAVAAFTSFMWQWERADHAETKGVLEMSQKAVTDALAAVKLEKSTTQSVLAMTKNANALVVTLQGEKDATNVQINALLDKNRQMRATEERLALAAPFQRGNAATARLNRSLCIIAGRKDCDRSSQGTGDVGAVDPALTDAPRSDSAPGPS